MTESDRRSYRRALRTATRRRTAVLAVCAFTGCGLFSPVPDQSAFLPIDALSNGGQAVARLYVAPLPGLQCVAVHTWFAVKHADATTFDRWELWQAPIGQYGHVCKNLSGPSSDVGAGGVYVIAELIGPEAEPVVAFIEAQSPEYSCRNAYVLLPGPNCNTYTQWVLDSTGWNVALPPTAIGSTASPACP